MNIFASSPDPVKSAHALCDRRVNKTILESAQMLSATIHAMPRFGSLEPYVYRMGVNPAWQRHPCTIWTRASPDNFAWLLTHLEALCDEYTYRYERLHPTAQLLGYFYEVRDRWAGGTINPPEDFANCTSSVNSYDYRELPVHLAHQCRLGNQMAAHRSEQEPYAALA